MEQEIDPSQLLQQPLEFIPVAKIPCLMASAPVWMVAYGWHVHYI